MLCTFFHSPRTSARTIGYDLSQMQLLSLYMYLTSFCPTSFDLMALCIVHTAGAIFFACRPLDE